MSSDTIYDHPLYYDILFAWDRSQEADFYERVLERSGVAKHEPVLEVACGTGRVAALLARRGWRVTGLDLRADMLAFARAHAGIEALRGDMTAFSVERPFAAAYNPLSSFRLLRSDAQAEAHLVRMAVALRPGAVYVLDLELAARADEPARTTDEAWEMTRDGITVRAKNDAVYVDDRGRACVLVWGSGGHLRGYTAEAFAERVRAAGGFAIASWHPELGRATGVSEFDADAPARTAAPGRTMVVLRRI